MPPAPGRPAFHTFSESVRSGNAQHDVIDRVRVKVNAAVARSVLAPATHFTIAIWFA
jgi:hypothetical protein